MTEALRAVIYCRVSSERQAEQGHGLESQEQRCRQYAANMGYHVEAVFPDDVSGGGDFMKRPGMVALLSYLDAQRGKPYVVIFDDLKRFARDTEFHIALRRAFQLRRARVECLNFKFEDTPEGRFVETIFAAQGELEREQNRRQVTQKMKSRAEQGYFLTKPPIGYRYAVVAGHGKLLVRNEPFASIVAEALEGFAIGRFETKVEVSRFLEQQPAWPKNDRGRVTDARVDELLKRPTYAGRLSIKAWGLNMIPAKHEALVSLATWIAVQERLKAPAKAPARRDLSEAFILRGFVTCDDCGKPLTAAFTKGRSATYGYYSCDTPGCPSCRKSVRKELMEEQFEELLRAMRPSEGLFNLAFQVFRDLWNAKVASVEQQAASLRAELSAVGQKIEELAERIVDATSETVIAVYDRKIRELELQRAALTEKTAARERPLRDFGETYRTAFDFLANPLKLWGSPHLEDRRAVLRLVFTERLSYRRGIGYRTAQVTAPFRLLGVSGENGGLVEQNGIEPSTS